MTAVELLVWAFAAGMLVGVVDRLLGRLVARS